MLNTLGGARGQVLASWAAVLAGTVVGLPAAFRAPNAIPTVARLELRAGSGAERTGNHHC